MTRHYIDLESAAANTWFSTREELWSWLAGLVDSGKPFGAFFPGRLGTRTEEARTALTISRQICGSMPEITASTDPAAWARECLHAACMAGSLDGMSEPHVLRWLVWHVQGHARVTVEDLQGLAIERAGVTR